MQITFRKLVAFWFFLPRRKNVCLLEMLISISEWKGVSHPVRAALKRDFEDVHSKNLLVCLVTTSWICWLITRQGKSLNWILIMWLLSSQDQTGHQKHFHMWEIPSAVVFTCLFFPNISRLCDRKFVFRFSCKVSLKCSRKCHRSIKEGNFHKDQIVVCGGLENSPKKSSRR